jgi:hypothetical protein
MPFDFPDTPNVGDNVILDNGSVLQWDGGKWISVPPTLPPLDYVRITGSTMTGPLYLSGNAVQPLGAVPLQQVSNAVLGLRVTVSVNPPASPLPGQLWWDSNGAQLYLWYQDVDSSQWVITNNFGGGFVELTGSTMTGPLILEADPTAPLGAATKQMVDLKAPILSPGFTGIPLCPTAAPGTSNGQIANTSFVANLAALYLPLTGGTITGALTVDGNINTPSAVTAAHVHSTGSVQADTDLIANSRLYCNDSMNSSGIFYVASNYAYYLGRSGGDGNWRFVEGGTVNATVQTDGTVVARTQFLAGSYLGAWGVLNSAMGLGWWMAFNWDGTNVPAYANGNYACTLVSSTWVSNNFKNIGAYTPNQNVDYNASPTFWDTTVGGTFYAQNAGANHQFSNVIASYLKSNGWLDCANFHAYGTAQIDSTLGASGAINCGDVRPGSCNGVYYGCYGQWVAFYLSGNNVYCRIGGQYDFYIGVISDENVKQEIAPAKFDCLAAINAIPLYEFRYKDFGRVRDPDADPFNNPEEILPARPDAPLQRIGFVAQKLHEVFPDAAYGSEPYQHVHGERETPKNMGVNTQVLLAALVGSVQQLAAEVAALKAA